MATETTEQQQVAAVDEITDDATAEAEVPLNQDDENPALEAQNSAQESQQHVEAVDDQGEAPATDSAQTIQEPASEDANQASEQVVEDTPVAAHPTEPSTIEDTNVASSTDAAPEQAATEPELLEEPAAAVTPAAPEEDTTTTATAQHEDVAEPESAPAAPAPIPEEKPVETPAPTPSAAATAEVVMEEEKPAVSVKELSKKLSADANGAGSSLSPSSSPAPGPAKTSALGVSPSAGRRVMSPIPIGHASPLQKFQSPPPTAMSSQHDQLNTTNAVQLIKLGAFSKVPLQDFFPYDDLLKLRIEDGIDATRKEDYLTAEEFEKVFKISREAYTKLPAWKRVDMKKKVYLF